MQEYIHKYIHTHIHTYIHTYIIGRRLRGVLVGVNRAQLPTHAPRRPHLWRSHFCHGFAFLFFCFFLFLLNLVPGRAHLWRPHFCLGFVLFFSFFSCPLTRTCVCVCVCMCVCTHTPSGDIPQVCVFLFIFFLPCLFFPPPLFSATR